jgi:phospholipase C
MLLRSLLAAAFVVATCVAAVRPPTTLHDAPMYSPVATCPRVLTTPICWVVVIVQENRTVDNLFNGYCTAGSPTTCANTVRTDPVTGTVLSQISMSDTCGGSHSHNNFVTEYDNGALDGWPSASYGCQGSGSLPSGLYAYVNPTEVAIYWQFAQEYAFADNVFQMNEGPSYPAHQYLIAGQSGGWNSVDRWAISENAVPSYCGAASTQKAVTQINLATVFPGMEDNHVFPCKDYPTIFDAAREAGYSTKYYTHDIHSFWSGVESVAHLWNNASINPVSTPETNVLADIASCNLANVTYVTPSWSDSDHPHKTVVPATDGPNWVGTVANAIGQSSCGYWPYTAILVTWDDWGGWYDHVRPPVRSAYEDGFRVPLLVISPYAQTGTIYHTATSDGAILRYIENTLELPSLETNDALSDNLAPMFNYSQTPAPYVPANVGSWTPPPAAETANPYYNTAGDLLGL